MKREAGSPRSRFGRDITLVIVCALICAGLIFGLLYDVFDGALRRWTDRDLSRHAHLIGVAVESHARDATPETLQRVLDSVSDSEDAAGLLVCSAADARIALTGSGGELECRSEVAQASMRSKGKTARGVIGTRSVLVTAHPIGAAGTVFVLQDRSFVDARRKHLLLVLFISAEAVLLALLFLARAGAWLGSRRTEEAARSVVRQMRSPTATGSHVPADLRLLARDVHDTVELLRATPDRRGAARLRAFVETRIPSGGLVVVANREPYAHERKVDGRVVIERPASGLVTAIEPILRACGGTWVGHGSGAADRAHADRAGRLAVPPAAPEYTLRRVWLGEDEYERYYSGFANEGLWPLCHIAHTQPAFRAADWAAYQSVNETFARAAVEEAAAGSLLLIQDYHFALVPRMIRNQTPHAVTSLFWHIPWPNAEMVGICPWKESLLEGMIGADVVGFHTRQHCLNFLESAERYLECRVDREQMSVTYGGHRARVRAYPISVEWPYPAAPRDAGSSLRRSLGIPMDAHVSVGVDRADYTKGLLERVAAIELLLEQNPLLIGRYVLVQLASPTRSSIRRYQQLADDLREAVARVNDRFGTAAWKPIVLQMKTFTPHEVRRHYAMANSAVVTPLHDGMNLVAKEYVASCEDGDGALVLSEFAGAAKELEGALVVNPYDAQQVAQAILRAIHMPGVERRARMQVMRDQIASSSIYHWSEKLLTDMCEVRQERARFWPERLPFAAEPREVVAG